MLKEYELGGAAQFDAEAKGPADKLGYQAKLVLNGLTAKSPQLKAQPRLDGLVHVSTDQVDQILLTMKAPANDLKLQGKVVSFTKPKVDLSVTSTGMDLDQLIVFPPPQASKKSEAPVAQATSPSAPSKQKAQDSTSTKGSAQTEDYDALLQPLRENKTLVDMVFNMSVQMAMLKAKQVKMTDLACKLSMKDLVAGVEQCGLKVFSGAIKADTHIQMKPKAPTYQFNAQTTGLDLGQAVESQMAMFKDTVTGKADFKMSGHGSSFNPDPAISNLDAKGTLKVNQAKFATVDVSKMVSEAITGALKTVSETVPGIKGKLPSTLGNVALGKGTSFEFISSDFTISQGKFTMPNFFAKAAANQGLDLKGQTVIGLKDYSLKSTWDVIDTYNLTKVKDISVEQGGAKIEHVFTEKNAPFHFTVNLGCTIKSPCYSYTEVPGQMSKVALNNVSQQLQGRAKEEARKQAESLLKKAPPDVQKQVNEGIKKLFR
jgi:hypothetical protein